MSHKTTRLKIIINYQKKIRIRQASYFEKVTNQKVQRRENSTKYFYRRFSTPELCQNLKYLVKIVNTSQLLTDLKGWQQRKIIFKLVTRNKEKSIQNNPKIILKSKRNILESLFSFTQIVFEKFLIFKKQL